MNHTSFISSKVEIEEQSIHCLNVQREGCRSPTKLTLKDYKDK